MKDRVRSPATGLGGTPAYSLYGEDPELGQSVFSNVESITVRSNNMTSNIELHVHFDLYQFVYILKGKSTLVTPSERRDFGEGSLVLVPPNFKHGFDSHPDIETIGYVITISDLFFDRIAQRGLVLTDLTNSVTLVDDIQPALESRLITSIDAVIEEHSSLSYLHVLAKEASVMSFIVEFLRLIRQRQVLAFGEDGNSRQDFLEIDKIKHLSWLIDRHYRSHKSVLFYAESLGVSPSNLNKISVSATGKTVHANIKARLLDEARSNLANTNLSVKEIGYRLGYEDSAYFTRFFSTNIGLSPLQFRRLALAQSANTSPE